MPLSALHYGAADSVRASRFSGAWLPLVALEKRPDEWLAPTAGSHAAQVPHRAVVATGIAGTGRGLSSPSASVATSELRWDFSTTFRIQRRDLSPLVSTKTITHKLGKPPRYFRFSRSCTGVLTRTCRHCRIQHVVLTHRARILCALPLGKGRPPTLEPATTSQNAGNRKEVLGRTSSLKGEPHLTDRDQYQAGNVLITAL